MLAIPIIATKLILFIWPLGMRIHKEFDALEHSFLAITQQKNNHSLAVDGVHGIHCLSQTSLVCAVRIVCLSNQDYDDWIMVLRRIHRIRDWFLIMNFMNRGPIEPPRSKSRTSLTPVRETEDQDRLKGSLVPAFLSSFALCSVRWSSRKNL